MQSRTSNDQSAITAVSSSSSQPGFLRRLGRSAKRLRSAPSSSSSSSTSATSTPCQTTFALKHAQVPKDPPSTPASIPKPSAGRTSETSAPIVPSPSATPSSPTGAFSRFTTRLRGFSNPNTDVNDQNLTSLLKDISKDAPAMPKLPKRPVTGGSRSPQSKGAGRRPSVDTSADDVLAAIKPSVILNLEVRTGTKPEVLVYVRDRKQPYSSREFRALSDRQRFKDLIYSLLQARGNPLETNSLKIDFMKQHVAVIARESRTARNVYPTLLNDKTVFMGRKGLNR